MTSRTTSGASYTVVFHPTRGGSPHNLPHPHHARDVHSDVVATEIFQTSFFEVDRDAIWRHWHQHVSDDMKRQAKARPITP
jgi:hypothetical protein